MDGLASISGVGAVAGQVSFTASAPPVAQRGPRDMTGDISASALKLIQAAVANTPAGAQQLDVKV